MFYGPLKEGDTVKIIAFKEFLQFIHLHEVTFTIENTEEIVRLADKYNVLDYFETLAIFLKDNLTSENRIWGYQLAITLDNAQLKAFCVKRIEIAISVALRWDFFCIVAVI